MENGKVIVAGWYAVDPGRRDQVVESVRKMVLRARAAPGCLDFAITADPVEPDRVNIFEFWQSGKDLDSWRTVSSAPKPITSMLRMEVQKHVIQQSGPPFAKRRSAQQTSTRAPRKHPTPKAGSAAKRGRPE